MSGSDAGTAIGPRCATIHVGQEADALRAQAGYTTATDPKGDRSVIRLQTGEDSIYGLLERFAVTDQRLQRTH
jgi:hypothetical protein